MNSPRRHSESHQTERPRVNFTDLCVGCIVWLPVKTELNGGIKCNCAACIPAVDLEDGGYGHPVVVVRIRLNVTSRPLTITTVCDVVCVKLPLFLLNVMFI
jgi:hypothetical protein